MFGGPDNAGHFLAYADSLCGGDVPWLEPKPLPPAGLYPSGDWRDGWDAARPSAVVVFYRALVLSGDTAPVDAALAEVRGQGLNAHGLFVQSLKDAASAGIVEAVLGEMAVDVVVNATGFAVASPTKPEDTPFGPSDCPVLQVVLTS